MASKNSLPPPVGRPVIGAAAALAEVKTQIQAGTELLSRSKVSNDDVESWVIVTKNVLARAFGENHSNIADVIYAGNPGISFSDMPDEFYEQQEKDRLQTKVKRLEATAKVLELQLPSLPTTPITAPVTGRGVFLVHGRDRRRHEVETVLRKLGLDVVVLADQPSAGMTIIEKLEAHADCAFAVVLLTGDDVGKLNDPAHPDLRPRARQNVILELGYFIGKLGRKNVCTLYQAGVELPSDYVGVGFVLLDEHEGWKQKLAKELKAAGFKIDMNLLD